MATDSEKKAFIQKVWNAIKNQNLNGLFPSVLIAQCALESGWGKSTLARDYNNFFGIKADSSWKGRKVSMSTKEVSAGETYTTQSYFRIYDSLGESIKDRNKFLKENQRYTKAGVFEAETPRQQVEALKNAGYATATKYVDTIMNIIDTNNLTEFDEKKKSRFINFIGIGVFIVIAIISYIILKR